MAAPSSSPPTEAVPSSPPAASSQPLAPQSPYVVISSSSSRDRPSRRLRIPFDYSNDGSAAVAEAVIAATGEGSPLLASRRHLAQQRDGSGDDGARQSIYALADNGAQTQPGSSIIRPRPRPRFWYLLPLLSLLDVLLESLVSFPLLFSSSNTKPTAPAPTPIDGNRARTLTATLLSACLLRTSTLSIVAIGNRTDQLGLIVAGVCAASALVGVSVFNLLFQEGMLAPSSSTSAPPSWLKVPTPSLTLLTSLGLASTVLEYIMYVGVVGIRVPPRRAGGVGRMGDVRRWKRGVRAVGQQGQVSDWSVYMEDEEDEDDAEGEGGEPSRKRQRAGYGDATTTLAAASSGSGSNLLLPEAALTPPPTSTTSYGALEQSRPLSSLLPQSAFSAATSDGSLRAGGSGDSRRRTTSTTSSRSRGLDMALPTSSSASPAGSTGRLPRLASSSSPPSRSPNDGGAAQADLESAAAAPPSDGEGADEDDEEDADPNEILDIPSFPSSTSRDASRMRLALASEPPDSRRSRSRRGSRALSVLSAIRGGGEGAEEDEEEEAEEVVRPERGEEEVEVAVPQRRRGWRKQQTGIGAPPSSSSSSTSLLPFKRKKPQQENSGAPAAAAPGEASPQSGGGWRAGGRRFLRSALPGGGGRS